MSRSKLQERQQFARDGTRRKIEDHHVVGVFAQATWLGLLRDAGFRARIVVKRAHLPATRPLGRLS
ncbi:MAG: hypothetical protein SGJ03_06785 [Alphaproteobacteria bacterium]|nr:hypothetical protein [Alphaproteobacteria bacterium]